MKKNCSFIICFYLLVFAMPGFAQVSIFLSNPSALQVKPADMFRATATNTSGLTHKFYFIGTISKAGSLEKIVEARTQVIELGVGAIQLNEFLLQPVYRYFSSAVQQTGYLPYGNYEICLKAYQADDNEEKGAACTDQEVTPLSPPLLISPENGSTVPTPLPLLVWLGPMPVNSSMPVHYDLKLVEVTQNQTPYDAIRRNFALVEQKGIHQTIFQYPANAMTLEASKVYAWQIAARSADNTLIGETEVWTFTLAKEKGQPYDPGPPTTNYIKMKKEITSDYTLITKEIRAVFNKEHTVNHLDFRVLDLNQKVLTEIEEKGMKSEGNNKYVIAISTLSKLKKDNFYLLEATYKETREKQYLLFRYISK